MTTKSELLEEIMRAVNAADPPHVASANTSFESTEASSDEAESSDPPQHESLR